MKRLCSALHKRSTERWERGAKEHSSILSIIFARSSGLYARVSTIRRAGIAIGRSGFATLLSTGRDTLLKAPRTGEVKPHSAISFDMLRARAAGHSCTGGERQVRYPPRDSGPNHTMGSAFLKLPFRHSNSALLRPGQTRVRVEVRRRRGRSPGQVVDEEDELLVPARL